MQSYFQKLSSKVSQIIATVADSVILTPVQRTPVEDLQFCFRSACSVLDELAKSDEAASFEADRMLISSNIKGMLSRILRHLYNESEKWSKEVNSDTSCDISEMPCFDVFLQLQVITELSRRAIRDRPLGTMPLVLGTLASWLRTLKYPILPHQSVHRIVSHLIFQASRYDILHAATIAAADSMDARQHIINYRKRIDTSLTSLISVIWRRISENPPILDCFTVYETSRPTREDDGSMSLTSSVHTQIQMDILTALISLMGKPRVGSFAKEALLVAINMRDSRVDSFILDKTKLLLNVVTELCRKFSTAQEQMVTSPAKIGQFASHQLGSPLGSAASTFSSQLRALTPRQAEVKPNALDALGRAIRLVDAISSASFVASVDESAHLPPGASPIQVGSSMLTQSILREYETLFLFASLRPSIESGGEQQALVNSTLLRRLLLDLSSYSLDGATLYVTTGFLCCSRSVMTSQPVDMLGYLVERCQTLSRTVNEASLQLLSLLLAVAPLPHALSLLDKRMITRQSNQAFQTPSRSNPITENITPLPNDGSSIKSSVTTTVSLGQRLQTFFPDQLSSSWTSFLEAVSTDDDDYLVTADARLFKVNTYLSSAKNRSDDIIFDPSDAQGQPLNIDLNYAQAAVGLLVGRLAGHINEVKSSCGGNTQLRNPDKGGSALLVLVLFKLGLFLTLTLSEQLAVASLLNRYMCVLGIAAIGASDFHRLDSLLLVLGAVEGLWAQVRSHILAVPDCASRYAHTRQALLAPHPVPGSLDGSAMRQALQSAVIVREMLGESRGCICAVQQLRLTLVGSEAKKDRELSHVPSSSGHGNTDLMDSLSVSYSEADLCEDLSDALADIEYCDNLYRRFGVELGPLMSTEGVDRDANYEIEFMTEYTHILTQFDAIVDTAVS